MKFNKATNFFIWTCVFYCLFASFNIAQSALLSESQPEKKHIEDQKMGLAQKKTVDQNKYITGACLTFLDDESIWKTTRPQIKKLCLSILNINRIHFKIF